MISLDFGTITENIINKYNYYVIFFIMFLGIVNSFIKEILLHRLIALSIFQSSIILLFLTIGFNYNSQPPIINFTQSINKEIIYSNPLPHALMLTAIVVGLATFAIGLAIIMKISYLKNEKTLETNKKP